VYTCKSKIYLPLIIASGSGETVTLPAAQPYPAPDAPAAAQAGPVQRAVANGMMMVVIAPEQRSTAFAATQNVIAPTGAEIRLGPGSNYGILASAPANTVGLVQNHPLNGIFAKGSYWWKISLGGWVGWVKEESLQLPIP
jgi:uncharacterized protein YraI